MTRMEPLADADQLIRLLDRWPGGRMVVAGDFMLDQYLYGNADRLSPDAPVPILSIERQESKPGGSANVCLDLRALRCQVACLGVVGDDEHGRHLTQTLRQAGCEVSGILVSPDRPTTVKQNFVGLAQHRHPQKMFRADCEKRSPLPPAVSRRLLTQARRLLAKADVLCLEDYNKGVLDPVTCQALIKLAKQFKVPVLVDPAAIKDYRKYRGVTCITPNRTEAALATQRPADDASPANLQAMAKRLLRELDLESVVLTLDKQGALLQEKQGKPILVPTVARQVYDVTGAGDMVLAMLAAARAHNITWPQAVQLANIAAGLEVEQFGVVPIPIEDVLLSLLRQREQTIGKVRTLDQLLPELSAYRRQGRKIVFTNGCFDILHAGHVAYLRQARQCGDLLVIGLNSDSSIRRIKGPDRPVNAQQDRLLVLSELQCVDYVILFDQDTPLQLIRAIKPDVLVKGADYRKSQVVGAKEVQAMGGKIVLVPLVEGRSTTNILRKLQDPQPRSR